MTTITTTYRTDNTAALHPADEAFIRAHADDTDDEGHRLYPEAVPQLLAEIGRLREEARWIPTAERMPDDYTLVLVTAPHVDEHIRLADHVPSCRGGCAFWRSRVNGCAITVTHWRPLPAPPEVQ